jgi:hypothetical protein
MAHSGNLIKERRYTGILDKQVLISIALAANESNLPLQPAIFLRILSTRGYMSSLERLS